MTKLFSADEVRKFSPTYQKRLEESQKELDNILFDINRYVKAHSIKDRQYMTMTLSTSRTIEDKVIELLEENGFNTSTRRMNCGTKLTYTELTIMW